MILLNTKSILQCDEKETEIHNNEIEMLFEQHLSSNPNLCQVTISYLDPH